MTELNLYAIDLSSSLAVEAYIPKNSIVSYALPAGLAAAYRDGTLWSWNGKVYLWNTHATTDSFVVFDIATEQWSSTPITGDVDGLAGPTLASVSIPEVGLSFTFGASSPSSFVKFNASDPSSLTWTNQTSPGP